MFTIGGYSRDGEEKCLLKYDSMGLFYFSPIEDEDINEIVFFETEEKAIKFWNHKKIPASDLAVVGIVEIIFNFKEQLN